jgi:hypothetical protein
MCSEAISLIQSGIVAENKSIYSPVSHSSLVFSKIFSISSLKPILSMTSASSSIMVLTSEKSMFPRSMWSSTLPVVPTKISTPDLSAFA